MKMTICFSCGDKVPESTMNFFKSGTTTFKPCNDCYNKTSVYKTYESVENKS